MGVDECIAVLLEYIEKMEPSEPYHKSELGIKALGAVYEIKAHLDELREYPDPERN